MFLSTRGGGPAKINWHMTWYRNSRNIHCEYISVVSAYYAIVMTAVPSCTLTGKAVACTHFRFQMVDTEKLIGNNREEGEKRKN